MTFGYGYVELSKLNINGQEEKVTKNINGVTTTIIWFFIMN